MRWVGIFAGVLVILVASTEARAQSPYPPSPVITAVGFAPVSEITCDATGSDNWPMAWGDDGHLYTSYGDGWGFDPRTELKLSLGFARIEGSGDAFTGINIRSPTGERTGDGASGPKASGMLMAGGVLYMWVRNTGNATLWSSDDHGVTWTEASWRWTTGYGAPTFLSFGADYAGAPDRFVYVYSQDGDSAYETYDGVALARAPSDRLMEESAWEHFAGFEADGTTPRWDGDVGARAQVLTHPGRSYRMDAAYLAPLHRYVVLQAFGATDASWAIFDAPAPWGPWTTVFYEDGGWDVSEIVHGFRLPTKWIAADGTQAYLVFSGRGPYDAFCVRRMDLTVGERPDAGPMADAGPGLDGGGSDAAVADAARPDAPAPPDAGAGADAGSGGGGGGCGCRVERAASRGVALPLLVVLGVLAWTRRCRR